jgi:hypothetical protein
MARSLMLAMTVAACSVLLVADFADARHCGRRHRGCGGGCGGYTSYGGCGGGCGSYGGCGGGYGGCGGGCQAMPYDGQPMPDNGTAPPPPPGGGGGAAPPPPSAAIPSPAPATTVTVNAAQPTYTPQYTNTVSVRRGLFGRR